MFDGRTIHGSVLVLRAWREAPGAELRIRVTLAGADPSGASVVVTSEEELRELLHEWLGQLENG